MTASNSTKMKLYELALEDGRSASPFVWRIRFALAHKGIPYETVYVGFTEIPDIFGGKFKTVPILEHGDKVINESWDIVEYLDKAYPDKPLLFHTPEEHSLVRFTDAWFSGEVLRKMFRVYVKDVHDAARPQDRPYFRESREKNMKGLTLESFTADRAALLPAIRVALAPLRQYLRKSAFLGGAKPNYADYIALSGFYWAASAGTIPLLERDDSLRDYLSRGFDLYGGIAREPGIKPLFE